MLDIYLKVVWEMPRICVREVSDMSEIWLRYAWHLSEIILRCSWDMSAIHLRYVWHVPDICLRYAWDMLERDAPYVNISKVSISYYTVSEWVTGLALEVLTHLKIHQCLNRVSSVGLKVWVMFLVTNYTYLRYKYQIKQTCLFG